jgi:hypothetical protein
VIGSIPRARFVTARSSSAGAPNAACRLAYIDASSRPTMSRTSSPRSISSRRRVATDSPSRSTVMRSATAKTSSSLCEM